MSIKFQSLVLSGTWHVNRSCCASAVRVNSKFELELCTWSFLLNFELIFDLKPHPFCLVQLILIFYEVFYIYFHSKRLPSKVTLLSLVLNVYFIGLQLYSEGKLYSSVSLLISNYCIAYRNNIVSRRNVRTYPGTRREFLEPRPTSQN